MYDRPTFSPKLHGTGVISRRTLLSGTAASLLGVSRLGRAQEDSVPPNSLVGIQIAPFSILDEGIERCLDTLQRRAAVNTLFIYSQSYYPGANKPVNVMANDHGIPVRDLRKSKLPSLWVRHQDGAFEDQLVGHQQVSADFEYANRDLFREIREPARQRGMKIYARILEADAKRGHLIPGYNRVLTLDHTGKTGHGPCWNNPHYRKWIYTTIRELVTNYDIDGLQYGAERTGPLSHVLYRGLTPTCFCEYCVARNQRLGIDAEQARKGFAKLFNLMQETAMQPDVDPTAQKARSRTESVLNSVMEVFYRYPEVLSWDYQWFQADEEICSQVHRIAKEAHPSIDSGRHVDHQRSSWDFFFRAAMSYQQMAQNADFIKPIVYHEPMGPRLRWWVLDRIQRRLLSDLTLEQSLQFYYSLAGLDGTHQPGLEKLDTRGLGPEYVYQETFRCKQAVQNDARVYAGIGIDVPWYVPDGMERRPSDPQQLMAAVERAFDAGADGVLASREYDEMRMESLDAFGNAIRQRGIEATK